MRLWKSAVSPVAPPFSFWGRIRPLLFGAVVDKGDKIMVVLFLKLTVGQSESAKIKVESAKLRNPDLSG
jgi:hypothetical protein